MERNALLVEMITLYRRYRRYLFSVGIVFISLFVLGKIAFPQVVSILETRAQIREKEEMLQKLRTSFEVIKSADENTLDKKVEIVKSALPGGKEFIGIFLALSQASLRANVEVADFGLRLGRIYSKTKLPEDTASGALTISLSISASGTTIADLNQLADELQKVFPLAEVKKISFTESSGMYEAVFYYKPYNLSLFSGKREVVSFSPAEENLLTTLNGWK